MITIILCTIIWLISVGALVCVINYYDDLEEDNKEIRKVKWTGIVLFIFQLLCFCNVLSAVAKL